MEASTMGQLAKPITLQRALAATHRTSHSVSAGDFSTLSQQTQAWDQQTPQEKTTTSH